MSDCFYEKFFNKHKIKQTLILVDKIHHDFDVTQPIIDASKFSQTINWSLKTQTKLDKGTKNSGLKLVFDNQFGNELDI